MNKLFSAVLVMWAGSVSAGTTTTITCEQYGHTNDPEAFFDMPTYPSKATFKVDGTKVVLGETTFSIIDPDMVGLKGLAVVYKDAKNNQLLYLYTNESGEKEVGVSVIEDASDTFFGDKGVYKQCTLSGGNSDASTKSVLRTATRGTGYTPTVYRF